MKAADLVRAWPASIPLREQTILEQARAGHLLPVLWRELDVSRLGHTGRVRVAYDALQLGEPGDAVRVSASPVLAQRLADLVGGLLPTTWVLDRVRQLHGVNLEPCIQPPDRASRERQGLSPSMSDAMAMVQHSRDVDARLVRLRQTPPILCNVGKQWVLTNRIANRLDKGANYGWFSDRAPHRTASGLRAWQPLGLAHGPTHVDYSQTVQLVHETMIADGQEMPVAEVLRHPELHVLVSTEGPLSIVRQPGVPAVDRDTLPPPPFVEEPSKPGLDLDGSSLVGAFMQARNYTPVDRRKDLRFVVIHTAEMAEVFTGAEALMRWAAGPDAPRASWHFAIDADSITQSVRVEHVAWHAPGANRTGIGIELVGRARQTRAEWEDEFSRDVLERCARLVAWLCREWRIEPRLVTAAGLQQDAQGQRQTGITTHWEVTKAFKQSTHVDPGPNFPMDSLLARVRELLGR